MKSLPTAKPNASLSDVTEAEGSVEIHKREHGEGPRPEPKMRPGIFME